MTTERCTVYPYYQALRDAPVRHLPQARAPVTSYPSIVLMRGARHVVARVRSRRPVRLEVAGWHIGALWYSAREACTIIHLGQECDLFRNGARVACGWNGFAEHLGDSIGLRDGDVLQRVQHGNTTKIEPFELTVRVGPHSFF